MLVFRTVARQHLGNSFFEQQNTSVCQGFLCVVKHSNRVERKHAAV